MNWFKYPWLIALLSAYYVWFSIGAWAIVALRIAFRRITRRELALLAAFLGCVALEIAQLQGETGIPFAQRESQSMSRYFGVFGPMLWIWAAWLLHALWTLRRRALRIVARLIVVGFCLLILFDKNIPFFVRQQEQGPAIDAWVAGALVAESIMNDWQGPPRRSCMMYSCNEYTTANLPAVFDSWSAAAWWVRGQSEAANLGYYPYRPDYLFLCEEGGYRGDQSKYNPNDYAPMARAESTVNNWMLLKRIVK